MNEPAVASQVNSLSWLIPTGENDIAVRELLIPIFGDAISCKLPSAAGAACNKTGGLEAITSNGGLVETLMQVFNAGTLVFATILLIFIALIGFIKTANDGEFFGKSWNTTFSAMRLVAGIAFILPMPNNYSTIQNFVLYNGLWSSGFANEMNRAVSGHYTTRLMKNIIKAEPNATSVDSEAKAILAMHICASLLQQAYKEEGADPRIETTSTDKFVREAKAALDTATTNPMGDSTGTTTRVEGADGFSSTRIEIAYVENGSYLLKGTLPCGRVLIDASFDPETAIKMESGIPNNAYGSGVVFDTMPLTIKTRYLIKAELVGISKNARELKIDGIKRLLDEGGPLRRLADSFVKQYKDSLITHNEDGSIKAVPSTPAGSTGTQTDTSKAQEAQVNFINTYTNIVRQENQNLVTGLTNFRTTKLEARANDADGFFAQIKILLEGGGWMSAAASYRTMLDMTTLQFSAEAQRPFRIESRDEIARSVAASVPGGMPEKFAAVNSIAEKLLGSDTAAAIAKRANMTPPSMSPAATPTGESMIAMVQKGPSPEAVMDTLYGSNALQWLKTKILKNLALSAEYDPLFQVKSMGEDVNSLSTLIIGGEMAARTVLAAGFVLDETKNASGAGKLANLFGAGATTGLLKGAVYMMEGVFSTMKIVSLALAPLGYIMSTWIPAIPFVAFLLAQLGWLFGLIMTLFAMNLWGVMHLTPARSDSFIGSETQGYLLLLALFFRPAIATAALSLSFIIAPPVIKLINITLLPMLMASSASTSIFAVLFQLIFGLVLYMVVVQGALTMIFMAPQSFPDEVMKIISAGIGDLGQSSALGQMQAGGSTGRAAMQTVGSSTVAGGEHLKQFTGKVRARQEAAVTAAQGNNGAFPQLDPLDNGNRR